MQAYERFLKYITYDTASDAESATIPSTEGQRQLGAALAQELKQLGVLDARMDEHGYVYGSIPQTVPGQPVIGLIAHMDTVSSVPVAPINARIVAYAGGDIVLNEATGDVLSPKTYPELAQLAGERLIVTDGQTLLGADDKAGIAEIMTMCEVLLSKKSAHGKVAICFTPDEEIGRGTDQFDLAAFGATFAYTLDGDALGGIEYENFNACDGTVNVRGANIHPGSAKGRMKNAALIATEFAGLLPAAETPAHTDGYEGFFHLTSIEGTEESACARYIIRDHDSARYEARKALFLQAGALLNTRYGAGTVAISIEESYRNMREKLEDKLYIVDRAKAAMQACGVVPKVKPIRGGTDGARLSWMGLPCPNLSTGGANYHGKHEYASIDGMEKMVEVLTALVQVAG
ncbi:MAG: peptidase T [Clostridia bacterium]